MASAAQHKGRRQGRGCPLQRLRPSTCRPSEPPPWRDWPSTARRHPWCSCDCLVSNDPPRTRLQTHWMPLNALLRPGLSCRAFLHIQYEMLEELGEGAFGKAFKARRRLVRFGNAPKMLPSGCPPQSTRTRTGGTSKTASDAGALRLDPPTACKWFVGGRCRGQNAS